MMVIYYKQSVFLNKACLVGFIVHISDYETNKAEVLKQAGYTH